MYFKNLLLNIFSAKLAKKILAIEYKIVAPIVIDIIDIKVPIH